MLELSIIFIHYGMTEARRKLAFESLQSLYESAKEIPCEIIVVDNGGSIDDSKHFIDLVEQNKITHYIRNADNVWFGKARNQALSIAEGKYLCVVDNDLLYKPEWLKKCLDILKTTEGQKLMVTPMPILRCHAKFSRKEKYLYNNEEYIINWRVGSNCWLMHRADWLDIGEFPDHHFSGTKWTNRYSRMWYGLVVVPGGLVEDRGSKYGDNYGYVRHHKGIDRRDIHIKKRLINGEEVIYWDGRI